MKFKDMIRITNDPRLNRDLREPREERKPEEFVEPVTPEEPEQAEAPAEPTHTVLTPQSTTPTGVSAKVLATIEQEPALGSFEIMARTRLSYEQVSSSILYLRKQRKIRTRKLDGKNRHYPINHKFSDDKKIGIFPAGKVEVPDNRPPTPMPATLRGQVLSVLDKPRTRAEIVSLLPNMSKVQIDNTLGKLRRLGFVTNRPSNVSNVAEYYKADKSEPQPPTTEPDQEKAQRQVPQTPARTDVITLAKEYYWDTGDTDLKKFIKWVEEAHGGTRGD
jgi:hypothetical protein